MKHNFRKSKLLIPVLAVFILSGCSLPGSSDPSVKVGPDGVEVNTPGANVSVNSNGVKANTPGSSVDVNSNGVNVSTGGSNTSVTNGQGEQSASKKNVVMIVDASGSMNETVGGQAKIGIAKTSAGKIIDKMETGTSASIVAYGHIGSSSASDKAASCNGIEEIYYFGALNQSVMKSKVNALPAKGWTPIAKSLEKAKNILASHPGESNRVLLISDGEESCGGDPVAMAKSLKDSGICVDVIGFDVSGSIEAQLKNISAQACGEYKSVNTASDFDVLINSGSLSVTAGGTSVNLNNGNMNVNTGDASIDMNGGTKEIKAGDVKVNTGTSGSSVKVDIPKF